MYLVVLGSHPRLSLAELSATGAVMKPFGATMAVVTSPPERHLGGSSKVAEIIDTLPTANLDKICEHFLDHIDTYLPDSDSKTTLGLSFYTRPFAGYRRFSLEVKRRLRQDGRNTRMVIGKKQALNSAEVIHNGLDSARTEFIIATDGSSGLVAQTQWVQDIEAYSKRDMERPCRDMNVGMLPPKLAQIMVNLAGDSKHIFDPFCGSGVILQEALLMGKSASGSDIKPEMTICTKKNLDWLHTEFSTPETKELSVVTADAKNLQIPPGVDAVVTEGYLGPVISQLESSAYLKQLAAEASDLLSQTLANLHPQLPHGARLCVAAPSWKSQDGNITPELVRLYGAGDPLSITSFDGKFAFEYNQVRLQGIATDDLMYRRSDQYVGRQLMLLEKK